MCANTNGDAASNKAVLFYIKAYGNDPFYKLIRIVDIINCTENEKPEIKKYLDVHKTILFDLDYFTKEYLLVIIFKYHIPFEIFGNNFINPNSFLLIAT